MGRFSPTVAPQYYGGDPGADIASAFQMLRERQRQEQQDADRQAETDYRHGQDRLAREDREYQLYGQPVQSSPQYRADPAAPAPDARLYDSGATGIAGGGRPDEMAASFQALRAGGLQRPGPEPTPGSFVPGRGFHLRYAGSPLTPRPAPAATDMQPGGMTPAPAPQFDPWADQRQGGRLDTGRAYAPGMQETTQQIGQGRYIDPGQTPEARARRQQQMIAEQLLFIPGISPAEAPLVAQGTMDMRDAMAEDPSTVAQRELGTYEQRRRIDAANPGLSERVAAGSLAERRRSTEREQLDGDAAGLAALWLRNDISPEQAATMLQAQYPTLGPGTANRIVAEAAQPKRGQAPGAAEEDPLYNNVAKLVPPTSPAEEFAARAIAAGQPEPESASYLTARGWSPAEALQIMAYYEAIRYTRP